MTPSNRVPNVSCGLTSADCFDLLHIKRFELRVFLFDPFVFALTLQFTCTDSSLHIYTDAVYRSAMAATVETFGDFDDIKPRTSWADDVEADELDASDVVIPSWAVLDSTVNPKPPSPLQRRLGKRELYTVYLVLIFLTNAINALICVTPPVKSQLK